MVIAALGAAGCQDESADGHKASRDTLTVSPAFASFVDIEPYTRTGNQSSASTDIQSATRSDIQPFTNTNAGPHTRADEYPYLPSGYVPFNVLFPTTPPEYNTIGLFMTPESTTAARCIYRGLDGLGKPTNDWTSTAGVTEDYNYRIYGFMPHNAAETASVTPLPSDTDNDYAEGAVVHLNNVPTLTPTDVCVVTGARLCATGEDITTLSSPLRRGSFSYTGQSEGNNKVFLLMQHLYSGLYFKLSIDPDYHKLRNIRITKMELEAKEVAEKVNVTVTLTANNTGDDPVTSVTYDNVGSATLSSTIQLFPFEGSGTEYELREGEAEHILGCYAPGKCKTFVLKTTYDVYDRNVTTEHPEGNLIRKGCVAENTISTTTLSGYGIIQAGELYTINMTVIPTYLYVLSEPDLDNPTIVVN